MTLQTTISPVEDDSLSLGTSGPSPVGATGSGMVTLTQVSGVSLDFQQLQLPTGADLIGCDMAEDTPVTGSVQEQLQLLNAYKQILRFASINQVTFSTDASGNLVLGLPQDIGTASSPTFQDPVVRKLTAQHLKGKNPTTGGPRVVAWGTGAGADSTPTAVAIGGHDIFITLSFTTSATPAASSVIAQIAFALGFDSAPTVIPVGLDAKSRAILNFAGSGLTGPVASNVTTGGFNFTAVGALAANQAYNFGFQIIAGP